MTFMFHLKWFLQAVPETDPGRTNQIPFGWPEVTDHRHEEKCNFGRHRKRCFCDQTGQEPPREPREPSIFGCFSPSHPTAFGGDWPSTDQVSVSKVLQAHSSHMSGHPEKRGVTNNAPEHRRRSFLLVSSWSTEH